MVKIICTSAPYYEGVKRMTIGSTFSAHLHTWEKVYAT